MEWTKTPPTENGWYWFRDSMGEKVVKVEIKGNRNYVWFSGQEMEDSFSTLQDCEWWPVAILPPVSHSFENTE